ncbi:intermembrane phospholipid transport protein YdbH family protein [Parvibaculum sp.]|uniref:intermembrane phospholipid transport protein YdbH family protein n=1 Tax=Parvibaculum sp. TaxID=2024848 RepID=UPI002FDAB420
MLKSWKGRTLLILCAFLLLAGGAAVYVWQQRAPLAEQVIGRALAERGIAPVSFRVSFIGLRSITLSDIAIGPGSSPDLAADKVTVSYSLGELLSGNVQSISVGEARARVEVSGEGISLGALDPLLEGEGGGGPLRLPAIDVENVVVEVETPRGNVVLAGPATVRPDEAALAISSDGVQISEAGSQPRFAPLLAVGQVRLNETDIEVDADLSSVIEGSDDVSLLHVEGRYDAKAGKGTAQANGALSFSGDGVTPARLLPVLKPLYLDVAGDVDYAATVEIDGGNVRVLADATARGLSLQQTAAGSVSFSGDLRFSKTFGNAATPYRLELIGLKATDLARPERFAPVTLEGPAIMEGSLIEADLVVRSALPAIRGARLADIDARYDRAAGKGRVHANASITFKPDKLELQTVLPVLKGVVTRMKGAATYSAEARLDDGNLATAGTVTLDNVGFVASAATVEGVNGTVQLSSLFPPRTKGVQVLSVRTLEAGVPLEDGKIAFELGRDGLKIVDASWPFADGKLVLVSSGQAVTASNAEFMLTVDNVDLATLLEIVDVPGLRATGHIGGRVPIAIRNGDPVLLDGAISAKDDGVIVYRGGAADAASTEQTKLLTDALQNFHYTELEGGLSGNANGNVTLRLNLRGANPDLYDGYPFAINVKLEGSLADILRRGTVGFRPLELIKEQSNSVAPPAADETEPGTEP